MHLYRAAFLATTLLFSAATVQAQDTLPDPARPEAEAPTLATPAASSTGLRLQPPVDADGGIERPRPPLLDLTRVPDNLWDRIRNGFGLPDFSGSLVREQEQWYASRPDYLQRVVDRSRRYLYHIIEEVEKRGMPAEIALLPIIESAYNPAAYSRAHAAGMWQFIPSTGKNYGLRQNFWYDGRRDVLAATHAALDYLEKLYDMFGSWDLALAAYNWGEGGISRAIARNQARGLPTDFRNLALPGETRYYLPKLQAVKNIVANPEHFGIQLADVPNQPYFRAVATDRPIDVKIAAKLADVPLEEFQLLNPAYMRPVIRAKDTRTLLLPADKAERFRANLDIHDEPLVSWQAYTVKRGDRADKIAASHGISVARLYQINGRKKIAPGVALLVPANGSARPYLPDLPAPPVKIAKLRAKHAKTGAKNGKAAAKKQAAQPPQKTIAAASGQTQPTQR